MSGMLSDDEIAELIPSEHLKLHTPIPTQIVSSDEFYPDPQNEKQKEVENRLLAMADELGGKQGLDRRRFFQTAAGMAASFVAMNEVYGPIFDVSKAEAATPAMAQERAAALKDQWIMDMHTHFLRDDTRNMNFVNMRTAVGKAGWNKSLADKEQTIVDLKYDNYLKEMFMDSDTKIALISSAPSDIEHDWFLTNEQMAEARKKVNDEAGSRRLFSHIIFTPGQPGWLEQLEAGLALKPESAKGYTIGDNTHKHLSKYPWRLDDEKVAYKGYELMVKAGIKNVCVHKGLFAPSIEKQFPHLRGFCDVADVGKAAKDWPQLNFVIYHSAYRHVGGDPEVALAEFERTGRISWTSDLADIPAEYGVSNVYGDVGQLFATTLIVAAARLRRPDGHADQGPRRRSRLLGFGRGVDRLAAVADRGPAPARDPRGHAEEARLRAARRRPEQPGEAADLRAATTRSSTTSSPSGRCSTSRTTASPPGRTSTRRKDLPRATCATAMSRVRSTTRCSPKALQF